MGCGVRGECGMFHRTGVHFDCRHVNVHGVRTVAHPCHRTTYGRSRRLRVHGAEETAANGNDTCFIKDQETADSHCRHLCHCIHRHCCAVRDWLVEQHQLSFSLPDLGFPNRAGGQSLASATSPMVGLRIVHLYCLAV